ncbi:lytic transglycosylase domain-containing protein [Pararhodobacter oceanensis]|uniref:lytic transglycosylase domain-containing protein n=1 Tax=Pararhodobacter oceanensis TaxID=2172121 RepID=UPI003A91A8FE
MPSSLPKFPAPRYVALLAAVLAVASYVPPANAEDFTFRRIAVAPQNGSSRITVQIDPEEQARRIAPPEPVAPSPTALAAPSATPDASTPPTARFGWYWDYVPAGLTQGEGRFLASIAALRMAPEGARIPEPSVQHLQDIAASHGARILGATIGTSVSPALALAVISVESAGRVTAVSHAGAQGLMQLIPATAERFGVSDSNDPAQNIRGGVAYLDWLLGEFDNDIVLALAGYNAGEGAVRRNGGVPPYAETRDYVPRVLAAWTVARGLCATVPQLPSDGCVFAISAVGGEAGSAVASR